MTPSYLLVVPQEEDARADEEHSAEFPINQWSSFRPRSSRSRVSPAARWLVSSAVCRISSEEPSPEGTTVVKQSRDYPPS
ncbi:hypothetical protein CEXT_271161 [Caerostris extrusa]|uniref:Uncharacterized protein n=1 Tax=Caerostris extrusa TaxID=172846 RepID=A0AAV4WQC5_CAEEX|nr:hypothetical protein CEXT_271161 [Caerostris extrusa]